MNDNYLKIKLKWLRPDQDKDIQAPVYHSELAAGMDVEAAITEPLIFAPGDIHLLPSGFSVAFPAGFELQVRPRSGLAIKHGITVVNSPGTIDADYRGEVKIGLINLGKKSVVINRGDRIAQLILAPVCRAIITEVSVLSETTRQEGGFGHTGL